MRKNKTQRLETRLSQFINSIPLCKCSSVDAHVAKLKDSIPKEEKLIPIVKFCSIFSNINRLKIVFLLLNKSPRCNCEIEAALSINQSTISHHIQVLETNEIINVEYSGKWSLYTIKNQVIDELFAQILDFKS